jgi:hypothetical protein
MGLSSPRLKGVFGICKKRLCVRSDGSLLVASTLAGFVAETHGIRRRYLHAGHDGKKQQKCENKPTEGHLWLPVENGELN